MIRVVDWLDWLPLRWLVFFHVLSAIAFLVTHAPSTMAMLKLRRERDAAAVRALLVTSRTANIASLASLGTLVTTGALLATLENLWNEPWLWISILILVGISVSMSPMAARALNEVRYVLCLPYAGSDAPRPTGAPLDEAALHVALERVARLAPLVVTVGTLGTVALVWLMVYRPG